MDDKKLDKKDFEELEKSIMGNVFLGNLIDMGGDLDYSGQNLAMYMELEALKEIVEKDNKK